MLTPLRLESCIGAPAAVMSIANCRCRDLSARSARGGTNSLLPPIDCDGADGGADAGGEPTMRIVG
eukprot:2753872-Prymnesium_polylepis.1